MHKTHLILLLALFTLQIQAQQTVGLFLNDSLAYDGYTLLMPNSARSTYLLDNCGRVVNKWTSENIPYFSTYLNPEGNLIRATRFGATGGGVERYNWEGELIWEYRFHGEGFSQHHDIELLPNGNILILAWESFSQHQCIEAGRDPDLVDEELRPEFIVEVEPLGTDSANIVWEWHAFDHLIQDHDPTKANYGNPAEHPELMDVNYIGLGGSYEDWLHANYIDYNPELDQIIMNSRNLNEFWIIDHSTTTEEAAGHTGGNSGKGGDILYRWGNPETYRRGTADDRVFYRQHNAHWIPEGRPGAGQIMVFNNGLEREPIQFSSVDVLTPPVDAMGNYETPIALPFAPTELYSSYTATPVESMYSARISSAQRLPNGHTLICVGQIGRLFEVDEDGAIYWDYITPLQGSNPIEQGNPIVGNSVFKVARYAPDFEGFIGKDLTPGAPIELNPLPSDCEIVTDVEAATFTEFDLNAVPNPAFNEVYFSYNLNKKINNAALELYNSQGQFLWKKHLPQDSREMKINVGDLPSGVYFYRIISRENVSQAQKLILAKSSRN